MAGLYQQSYFHNLIKDVNAAPGDQILTQGGIAFQLFPDRLPNTTDLRIEVIYRTSGFSNDITVKGIVAADAISVAGTQVFSQVINTNDWQSSGIVLTPTPVLPRWLVIVTNNPNAVGGAQIDETFLSLMGGAASISSYFLTF